MNSLNEKGFRTTLLFCSLFMMAACATTSQTRETGEPVYFSGLIIEGKYLEKTDEAELLIQRNGDCKDHEFALEFKPQCQADTAPNRCAAKIIYVKGYDDQCSSPVRETVRFSLASFSERPAKLTITTQPSQVTIKVPRRSPSSKNYNYAK